MPYKSRVTLFALTTSYSIYETMQHKFKKEWKHDYDKEYGTKTYELSTKLAMADPTCVVSIAIFKDNPSIFISTSDEMFFDDKKTDIVVRRTFEFLLGCCTSINSIVKIEKRTETIQLDLDHSVDLVKMFELYKSKGVNVTYRTEIIGSVKLKDYLDCKLILVFQKGHVLICSLWKTELDQVQNILRIRKEFSEIK